MQIPPDKNTRAEAMWRIISQEVDFRKKVVLDLGCGTGDFLWRVHIAGAEYVWGIDEDTYFEGSEEYNIGFDQTSIEELIQYRVPPPANIAFCFSVLPYVDDIPVTLQWMAKTFELCLIEAQYDPEPYNVGVASDVGMAQLLVNNGFSDVKPIGKTYVDIRDTHRTIWSCI